MTTSRQRSYSSERRRTEIVEFNEVIEIPKGQRNKYTLADDGDPLCALVILGSEPTSLAA